MPVRHDVSSYAKVLLRALQAHASNLSDPYGVFRPPGGITGFAARAFADAGLQRVSTEFIMERVVGLLIEQHFIERMHGDAQFYRVLIHAHATVVNQLLQALGHLNNILPQGKLSPNQLDELDTALNKARREVKAAKRRAR